MPRRLAPVLLCCLALLAASCASGAGTVVGSAAATVNGVEISEDDLYAQLDAIGEVVGYDQVFGGSPEAPIEVGGSSPGTFDVVTAASVLNSMVVFELARQDLDDRGEVIDDAVRSEVETQLMEVFPDLSADLVAYISTSLAALDAVGQLYIEGDLDATVSDEEVRAVFDADPSAFAQKCIRVIFLEADADGSTASVTAEADAVLAELEAGSDFATVATEQSDDATSAEGGDLGCNPAGQYLEIEEALASVSLGDPTDPIEVPPVEGSPGGLAIAQLYDEPEPPFEDVEAEIRGALEQSSAAEAEAQAQQAYARWQAEAVRAADVEVDPRFGTWTYLAAAPVPGEPVEVDRADADAAQIVPPEGPLVPTSAPQLVPGQGLLGPTQE